MSKVWLFEEIFKYFSSQMSCFHFASPNCERFQTAALLDDSRRLQMCVTGSVIAFDSVKRHRRTVWVTKPPPHQNPHRLARTSEERSGGVDLWSRRAAGTQTAVSFSHGGLWRQQSDGEESAHVSVLKGTSHQSDSESFWDVLEVVRDQRGFSDVRVLVQFRPHSEECGGNSVLVLWFRNKTDSGTSEPQQNNAAHSSDRLPVRSCVLISPSSFCL